MFAYVFKIETNLNSFNKKIPTLFCKVLKLSEKFIKVFSMNSFKLCIIEVVYTKMLFSFKFIVNFFLSFWLHNFTVF